MDPLLKGEQAALGAVLLDPHQLDRLDWLEPRDFYRPAHQALFTALRTLRAASHPALAAVGEVPLAWITDSLAEADKHVRGLTASYPHTLIAACPQPANAPVYGRMVLEGSIHRTVAEHAARLLAVTEEGAREHEVEGTVAQADVLAGVLADLAQRWGTQPRPTAPVSPTTSNGPATSPGQVEDERFLLSLLVHQDRAIEEVFGWLRPGDFADPGHGQLYRCLGALHHRGEPIDPVTTLWEVQRRGLLTDDTVTEEHLCAVFGTGAAGSAEWLGEQLLRGSLNRTAAVAARQIAAQAHDDQLAPGQLIGQALHALGPVDEVRTRWLNAISPSLHQPQPHADQASRVSAALARSPAQPAGRKTPGQGRVPVSALAQSPGPGPDHSHPNHCYGAPREHPRR